MNLYNWIFLRTDKQIIRRLIKDYEYAVAYIEYNFLNEDRRIYLSKKFLIEHHMLEGLCYYADKKYHLEIHKKPFLKRHRDIFGWWCNAPKKATTFTELVESLEKRIKLLKLEYDIL